MAASLRNVLVLQPRMVCARLCSDKSSTGTSSTSSSTVQPPPPPPTAVSGAECGYQADQLYTYNPWSFYDIENDMSKHRLKQPSSLGSKNPAEK